MLEIKRQNRADYDNEYDLQIKTTMRITGEEYKVISDAMDKIMDILEPHFSAVRAKIRAEEKEKND